MLFFINFVELEAETFALKSSSLSIDISFLSSISKDFFSSGFSLVVSEIYSSNNGPLKFLSFGNGTFVIAESIQELKKSNLGCSKSV